MFLVKIDPLEEFLRQEANKAKACNTVVEVSNASGTINGNGKRSESSQDCWEVNCHSREEAVSQRPKRKTRRTTDATDSSSFVHDAHPSNSSSELGRNPRYTCGKSI